MKTGYLGPEGSYSQLAAQGFCPESECVAYASFQLLMQALISGECDLIVLPIENSLNGGVSQNMDLLQSTDGVFAFRRRTEKIDHRLATLKGAETSGICRIYSHQQALAQCGRYLFENFPQATLIATQSTAAGLKMLKTAGDACIVGAHTNAEGVELSPHNIADETTNFTEFLLVRRGGADERAHSARIYFTATCTHAPGALLEFLQVVKAGGLNMTKIQSRPIKDKPGEYRFFIEVEGNYALKSVRAALSDIISAANSFKLLGAY